MLGRLVLPVVSEDLRERIAAGTVGELGDGIVLEIDRGETAQHLEIESN